MLDQRNDPPKRPLTMKLPRWTVYPALAVIMTLIVTAVPRGGDSSGHDGEAEEARRAQAAREALKKIVLPKVDPERALEEAELERHFNPGE